MTDSDSSRSRVAGTSRIDFTPAQTTTSDVRDSAVRSADSSKVSAACRCTPPRPPVANTPMPAAAASSAVLDTVVAPLRPSAAATGGRDTPSLARSGSAQTRSTSSEVQAHVRDAVEHRDRGRHRPTGPDGGLDVVGRGAVVRPWQAVRQQGALERDDGAAGAQGVGDFGERVWAGPGWGR